MKINNKQMKKDHVLTILLPKKLTLLHTQYGEGYPPMKKEYEKKVGVKKERKKEGNELENFSKKSFRNCPINGSLIV